MVIFWVLTVCGGVIRQYGNFYQNYNNFSKIVFSVYFSFFIQFSFRRSHFIPCSISEEGTDIKIGKFSKSGKYNISPQIRYL